LNLQEGSGTSTYLVKRPSKNQNGGKRWIRRKDNARFAGNPHIVAATQRDYALHPPCTLSTFPEPLPSFLPRHARLPTTVIPTRDANSANAGRFSMSLRGMRRDLRKAGFRAEALVRDVESEVVNWLQVGGTVLAPDFSDSSTSMPDSRSYTPVGGTGTIFEISRTPLQLIWSITHDAFARYVVHCCARYYEIVSFSKEISGQRFTYLLRPNVVYPDHHAPDGLDTPPMTDTDYSSQLDIESDHGTLDMDLDIEPYPTHADGLSSICEDNSSVPPILTNNDPLSVFDNADGEPESGASLTAGPNGLSLLCDTASEFTPNFASQIRSHFDTHLLLRRQAGGRHQRQERSTSSPSQSPVRNSWFKDLPLPQRSKKKKLHGQHQTFYDYLFL